MKRRRHLFLRMSFFAKTGAHFCGTCRNRDRSAWAAVLGSRRNFEGRRRMSRFTLNRRRFLQTTALGAAGVIAAPAVLRAQGAAIKVGILQPVSGAMSYSGQQGRLGATLAL